MNKCKTSGLPQLVEVDVHLLELQLNSRRLLHQHPRNGKNNFQNYQHYRRRKNIFRIYYQSKATCEPLAETRRQTQGFVTSSERPPRYFQFPLISSSVSGRQFG